MAVTQQESHGAKSYLEVKEVEVDGTETLGVEWTIPNWKEVRMTEASVNGQKVTLESSQYGKWVIGVKAVRWDGDNYRARVYWKLVDIYGYSKQLEVTVRTQVLNAQGEVATGAVEKTRMLALNEIFEDDGAFLDVLTTSNEDDPFIQSDGSAKYSLKLITKLPASNKRKLLMERFSIKSVKKLRENQASLLTDDANADLTIIARDDTKIRAHKAILMAQSPVFAKMLATEFREGTSGIIEVEDISGKTMKIVLHYFYTGTLLPTWSDEDTIVEFVYAAGKYQMNLVLDLLDNTLGLDSRRRTCFVDVQLLNLTEKLALKLAECRLLQRVVQKIKTMKGSKDLLELFGYDSEDVTKMAGLLGSEIVMESSILEIMDTLFVEEQTNEEENEMAKKRFQVLAVVQRKNEKGKVKKLEKLLLNRYGEIVAKFESAKELFNFFGYENL